MNNRPTKALYAAPDAELDIVRMAADMAPSLVSRQAETEQRTYYAPDTHRAFLDAGFYRMLTPRKFGGLEHDHTTYCRVIMAITSGCASSGWQLNLGASHTPMICKLFDDEVQAELFKDVDFICAATGAPQGSAYRLDNGDWSISGTFAYASGIPYSSHLLGHTYPIAPDGSKGPIMTFVAPRDQWQMLDDWGESLGLKGSGSHSVQMREARIPARFVIEGTDMLNSGGAVAVRPGDVSLFRHGKLFSLSTLASASMSVGMLRGAVTEYGRLMHSKASFGSQDVRHENPDYRRWLGLAAGRLSVVEAGINDLGAQWTAAAERARDGIEPFSAQEDLRLSVAAADITEISWDVFQGILWPTAGTSAARDGEVFQRLFRDMATFRAHKISILADAQRRDLSAATFVSSSPSLDRLWAIG